LLEEIFLTEFGKFEEPNILVLKAGLTCCIELRNDSTSLASTNLLSSDPIRGFDFTFKLLDPFFLGSEESKVFDFREGSFGCCKLGYGRFLVSDSSAAVDLFSVNVTVGLGFECKISDSSLSEVARGNESTGSNVNLLPKEFPLDVGRGGGGLFGIGGLTGGGGGA